MHSPGLTLWRLSQSGERCLGPSCNEGGFFLGRTPLLECESGTFVVRDRREIECLMSAAYGGDVALDSRMSANAKEFNDGRLESRENKVRIPYWKHREISDWYSTPNEEFGWRTPREYMRGKNWEEQYNYGLLVLRKFGALK
jgi:hypothetical protein